MNDLCKRMNDLCERMNDLCERMNDLCERMNDLCERMNDLCKRSARVGRDYLKCAVLCYNLDRWRFERSIRLCMEFKMT